MTTRKPVILLELNELTPQLIDRFIAEGHLPNFERLRDDSQAFVTDAQEQPPQLEPWIQWVTVATGMPYGDHKVFNLGDNASLKFPSIWDIVSGNGEPVWVCGSMNAHYTPGIKGAVVPDPWSVHVSPSDPELSPYFDFVRANVQEHTRDKTAGGGASMRRFLKFMMTHGLSAGTIFAIVSQLAREKFGDHYWRRAVILDRLQFDLFAHYYRKIRPTYSTFFLNSVAHFQHMYWRHFQPELFQVRPSDEERATYGDAMLFGYRQMDRLIGDMRKLVGENAVLAFATALSQQPCLKYEGSGGKTFHRPHDFSQFLKVAGIDPRQAHVEPVMSEEFHLRFANEVDAERAARQMAELKIGEREVMRVSRNGNSLLVGCGIFEELSPDTMLKSATGTQRFTNVFYHVDLKKSGIHHPDGVFWVRVPGMAGRVHREKVPLVDVAPTLLALMDMPIPAAMPGKALVGQERRDPARAAA